MVGYPRQFESLTNRLGFQITREDTSQLCLTWCGTRFPGLLCLTVTLVLLWISIPVFIAIALQGFSGPASHLWYFPVMNLILLGVAIFLLSLKRTIKIDKIYSRIHLSKRSLFRRQDLKLDFNEVVVLNLGTDMVYSGIAVAGSTVGQSSFPSPSLRLILINSDSVLLDRGGKSRIKKLADHLGRVLNKPVTSSEEIDNAS